MALLESRDTSFGEETSTSILVGARTGVRFTTDSIEEAPWAGALLQNDVPTTSRVVAYLAHKFKQRRMRYTLSKTRMSLVLTLLAAWHTFGLWLSACIFLTLAANLLLSWYIEWFRNLETTEQHTFRDFPYAPFVAIFLRSWTMVCLLAEFIRFCFLLTVDCWRLDAFKAYRRAICGELRIDTEPRKGYAEWCDSMLSSRRRWIDTVWQYFIYISLDVVPLSCGLYAYASGGSFYLSGVAVRVALSASACIHVMLFFLMWNILDICLKVHGFAKAVRGDGVDRPRQYEGEALEDFQWAGSFGDRHLLNLEQARNISWSASGPTEEDLGRCISGEEFQLQLPESPQLSNCSLPSRASISRTSLERAPTASDSRASISRLSLERDSRVDLHLTQDPLPHTVRSRASSFTSREDQGTRYPCPGESAASLPGPSASAVMMGSITDPASVQSTQLPPVSEPPQDAQQPPGTGVASTPVTGKIPVAADKMNVCVSICGCLNGILGEVGLHACWILMIATGVRFRNVGLVLTGFMVGIIIFVRYTQPFKRHNEPDWSCPLCWGGGSWRLWSLQAWGERHCSLTIEHYATSNVTFGIVVLLQGILFAELSRWTGMILCGIVLCCQCLRQMLMSSERPWGWLFGCLEGVLLAAGTVLVNHYTRTGEGWGRFCLVVAFLRQFGLARHNSDSFQVVRFTTMWLNIVMVLVVTIVTLTASEDSTTSQWSALCHADGANHTEGCSYYDVPYKELDNMQGLMCQGRFYLGGNASNQSLTLSDFGLFSALAYESRETLNGALNHFFKGWRIDGYHFANTNRTVDWTTFFEFSDPDNTTTVFSVRGTDSKLDILNDINIWTPALIMQMFSAFGPDLASGSNAHGVVLLSTTIYGSFQKRYFEVLLERVQQAVKADPNRRFYITGHSLGGGLAKLVAAQVGIQAITFMAPGLSTTNTVVFGEESSENQRHTAFTVQPDNDIISRVDNQVGIVVQTECQHGPAYCHQMYPLLCELYRRCGSGRMDTLSLPNVDVNGDALCLVPAV